MTKGYGFITPDQGERPAARACAPCPHSVACSLLPPQTPQRASQPPSRALTDTSPPLPVPTTGGEDLFVHQTAIITDGFRSLKEGEAVEYVVETSDDGRQKAIQVTGPGGAAPEVRTAPRLPCPPSPRPAFRQAVSGGRPHPHPDPDPHTHTCLTRRPSSLSVSSLLAGRPPSRL